MLYAALNKESYYENFGFRKMKSAMAITFSNNQARLKGLIEQS